MSKKQKYNIEKGCFLVAEPFMMDPNFRRGVVLVCDHQSDGSFGFIINKPIDMNITDLISAFPDFESEVYYGGPVQTDTIHYLHTKGKLLTNSIQVLEDLYWGGDFEELKTAIAEGKIEQEDIRFFVGYSGWEAGQLAVEQELLSWMVTEGFSDFVLGEESASTWQEVLELHGDTYGVIAQMGIPNLN